MSAVRPSTALARAATRSLKPATLPTVRSFSVTARRQGGGSNFDPPSGWLWGVKPGEKYEREGWELPFYTLFCGGLAVAGVVLAFKPDTS